MEDILNKIDSLLIHLKKLNFQKVNENELKKFGLSGIELRDYQLDGINWMLEKNLASIGCILADEMGLGKTIQTISFLLYLYSYKNVKRPSIIIAPLSVVDNWKEELSRFASNISYICYLGSKEERNELRDKIKAMNNLNIIISTYEICLRDEEYLSSFNWFVMVVDEAHRLKNNKSLLHITLRNFDIEQALLLTGTPIQNNLNELYALLSFCNPNLFPEECIDKFVTKYRHDSMNLSDVTNLINPFILRRLKSDVIKDLPSKSEIILYHGLSSLQKKYYKAILLKDLDVFKTGNKTRLLNILSQLRKCVCHPYLFNGVEPEPFEPGEHLIEASCKLVVLDQLLTFLKKNGHKVLIFSQMTTHLDILQDYLTYREYGYERLDGSVRAEERYFMVKRFNSEKSDSFAFLLSTRAGGQGLNLTSADTVIILDSDFNPQNDLQASARAHRIGQTRNVKVIRFVCRDSVEEIIIKRAHDKLKLSLQVMDDKNANNNDDNSVLLSDILKFGLNKILSNSETDTKLEIDFEKILGKSVEGEWANEEMNGELVNADAEDVGDNMYMFEGHDYSKTNSKKLDEEALAKLLDEKMLTEGKEEKSSSKLIKGDGGLVTKHRQKKIYTPEELEERKKKQIERKEAIAKLREQIELKKAKEKQEKRLNKWKNNNYTSGVINEQYSKEENNDSDINSDNDNNEAIPDDNDDYINDNSDSNDATNDDLNKRSNGEEEQMINYLIGDVTCPIRTKFNKNVILHCVDNSGRWGTGGLFKCIDSRSNRPSQQYALAAQMNDLKIGDVHLIDIKSNTDKNDDNIDEITDYLALLVVQSRNSKNVLSQINIPMLEDTFKIVSQFALKNKASVHLSRIGDRSPNGNWYATERLVKKHFVSKRIPTYIYYYPRNPLKRNSIQADINQNIEKDKNSEIIKRFKLPDFLDGKHFSFQGKFTEDISYLKRQIIAYGGDYDETPSTDTTHLIVADDALLGEDDTGKYRVLPISELKTCIEKKSLK